MAVDLLEGAAALGSALQSAMNIAKGLTSAGDPKLKPQIMELQTALLETQQHAIETQSAHLLLHQKVAKLEKQIADADRWCEEAEKYQTHEAVEGVFVIALKTEVHAGKVSQLFCPTCFEGSQRKSHLQRTSELRRRFRVYRCAACKSDLEIEHVPFPANLPASAISDFPRGR